MSFFSYIKYKKCFDWAYNRTAPGTDCTKLVVADLSTFRTSNGLVFCVKKEE